MWGYPVLSLFGDWLTLVGPAMYDLSHQAEEWWDQTVQDVETLYGVWLEASPLQRLRIRPTEGGVPQRLQVEMKGVTMLLQVLPEAVKRDIVSGRTLSSTAILFKLFTLYQPGGGSEKAGLLKQISEPKIPHSVPDLLAALRQWRRWLSRADELRLTLPDASILANVLGRFADALSKVGGNQMNFRVSAARQELGVDRRPTMGTIKDLAEYLQAESEELSLMMGMKAATSAHSSSTATTNPTGANPAVKAMTYGNPGADQGETKPHKAPCRFWKSDEGRRKRVECTYLHDATDMKGRCFGCRSTSHVKRDCPVKRPGDQNPKAEKVKKIHEKIDRKGDKPTPAPCTTTTTDAKEDGKTKVSAEPVQGRGEPPEVTQGTPISATDELLKEAAGLLKSLKSQSLKAIRY